MKIGLVCPYDIFRPGGVQEHVLAQAEELRRRGHEVKILTPRARGNQKEAPEGVIFVGNSTHLKMPTKTALELGIALDRTALEAIFAAEKFDILQVHEPEIPLVGAQLIAKAGCPVIGTFHAVNPNTPVARTIEGLRVPFARPLFSKLAAVTAVSEAATTFVRDHTKKPITIIPNGINLKKYQSQKHHQTTGSKTILYIGRLEKRKGVKHLLEAYKLVSAKHPNIRLVIAGEGHLRSSLETFTKTQKLKDVSFLGYVDEPTKLELLHSADLFCSPALFGESFGIVLLEAMAAGVPIVAGNNIGYAGLMKNTGQISIVDPQDPQEFAQRLELLLFDEKRRQTWRTWAKKYVKQFDYPKVVDSYEKLYKQVLGQE